MTAFDIAYISEEEDEEDLILIPLNPTFGEKTPAEQREFIETMQACAARAELEGIVIPVWQDDKNIMNFIAPDHLHPFLNGISYNYVLVNVNRKLRCG